MLKSFTSYDLFFNCTEFNVLANPNGLADFHQILYHTSLNSITCMCKDLARFIKGQHQCNSIDFWTFYLGWRKGSKKKRFEDVFGHVFEFPGKFYHWQISQNGGTGATLLQRVFLRHALELPQIWSWNKNNFFFLNLHKYS